VWKREVKGRVLRFHLAGINNQNFLMRDNQTGSWWQQVTGRSIFGDLKDSSLELVPSDELTFGLWKQEWPDGQVLLPVAAYAGKYESNWEPEIQKLPTVVNFPDSGVQSRKVVLGVEIHGVSRAYPLEKVRAQWPIQDLVGGTPILLVVAADGKSVRGFVRELNGAEGQFFRKTDEGNWGLVDSTGHDWNFQGCPAEKKENLSCLQQVPLLKDYWFDWRNYHPNTSVYRH
jgi:hypothetical protein